MVVEDENAHPATRQSYISLIRSKLPDVKLRAVNFVPSGGSLQCLWARQFAILEHCQTTGFASVADVQGFFSSDVVRPCARHEGFFSVSNVRTVLYSNCPQKFDRPALLVDAAAVVTFVHVESDVFEARPVHAEAGDVIQAWRVEHGTGVVVALVDEAAIFPASLEILANEDPVAYLGLLEQYHHQVVGLLRTLGVGGVVGVRYQVGGASDSWLSSPNPGLLAAAQRLFRVDLAAATLVCRGDEAVGWSRRGALWGLSLATVGSNHFFQPRALCGWGPAARLRRFALPAQQPPPAAADPWAFLRAFAQGSTASVEELCTPCGECGGCFWWSEDVTVGDTMVGQEDKGKEEEDDDESNKKRAKH